MTSINGNIVTMPLGFTATEDSDNLAVINADFPADLKLALSMIVSASNSDTGAVKNSSVKSYSIGSKTVNYLSSGERDDKIFENIIKKYITRFNRAFIKSI